MRYVIPNPAYWDEESVFFKISWFDKQISRFVRDDSILRNSYP